MYIRNMFDKNKVVFSLEIFPPKKTSGIATIYNTLEQLTDVKPDFISVTYGAGGTSTDSLACKIASDIKNIYKIEPMAHLTSIHTSKIQAQKILTEFRENNIENILALRGDKQPSCEVCQELKYASDLTKYIKDFGGFDICGACYPEGHPESPSLVNDVKNLKYKVEAGVSHLVSQLFFDNNDFYNFMDMLRLTGVDIPVEAGIMPVVNKHQIERTISMCGASVPKKFAKMISRYENNPEAMFDAGIAYAIDQIIDLISNGVDGIHLYTMNNPIVASRIYNGIKNVLDAGGKG